MAGSWLLLSTGAGRRHASLMHVLRMHPSNCTALHRPPPLSLRWQEVPASLGRLLRLKMLQLDSNQIGAIPPAVLQDCAALATITLHDNPITPAALQATPGYAAFEARRQSKVTKGLATGVLLGHNGLDEGVDRRVEERGPPTPRSNTA